MNFTLYDNARAKLHNASMLAFGKVLKISKESFCPKLQNAIGQLEKRKEYTRGTKLAQQFMRFMKNNIKRDTCPFILTAEQYDDIDTLLFHYYHCRRLLDKEFFSINDAKRRVRAVENTIRAQFSRHSDKECAL